MQDGETDYDQPGYRENAQFSDEELEDMANERSDVDSLLAASHEEANLRKEHEEQMARDMPYIEHEFALNTFIENCIKLGDAEALQQTADRCDSAIVECLKHIDDLKTAAEAARRARRIPDPVRKARNKRYLEGKGKP